MIDIKQNKSKIYDLMRNCRYTQKGLKDFKKSVEKQIENNLKNTKSFNILKQTSQSTKLLKQSYKCLRSFKQRQKSEYMNLKSLFQSRRMPISQKEDIKIQKNKKKNKNLKKNTSKNCSIMFPKIKPKFEVNFKPKNASLSQINLRNSMFEAHTIKKQSSQSYLNKHYQDLKKGQQKLDLFRLQILKQITEENVKKTIKLQKRSKYFSVSQNSNY